MTSSIDRVEDDRSGIFGYDGQMQGGDTVAIDCVGKGDGIITALVIGGAIPIITHAGGDGGLTLTGGQLSLVDYNVLLASGIT